MGHAMSDYADLLQRLRLTVSPHAIDQEAAAAILTLVGANLRLRQFPALKKAEDENARLREALMPFARVADAMDDTVRSDRADDWMLWSRTGHTTASITVGHVRKARDVLKRR